MTSPSASASSRSTSSEPSRKPARLSLLSFVTAVLAAAVGSLIAVGVVALIVQALGVPGLHVFQPSAYIPLVVIGVIAGAVGWLIVVRFAQDARAVLTWLVPTVLLISFVPDVLLGMGLLGGEAMTVGATIGLMIMHVAVAVVAVPVFARLMPDTRPA